MDSNDNDLRIGLEIKLKEAQLSELSVLILILEELRRRHPKIYPVATKAIEEAEKCSPTIY